MLIPDLGKCQHNKGGSLLFRRRRGDLPFGPGGGRIPNTGTKGHPEALEGLEEGDELLSLIGSDLVDRDEDKDE